MDFVTIGISTRGEGWVLCFLILQGVGVQSFFTFPLVSPYPLSYLILNLCYDDINDNIDCNSHDDDQKWSLFLSVQLPKLLSVYFCLCNSLGLSFCLSSVSLTSFIFNCDYNCYDNSNGNGIWKYTLCSAEEWKFHPPMYQRRPHVFGELDNICYQCGQNLIWIYTSKKLKVCRLSIPFCMMCCFGTSVIILLSMMIRVFLL